MLRRLALVLIVSCQPPGQNPPPVEIGPAPPMPIAPPAPRSIEEGDSWTFKDAGAPVAQAAKPPPAVVCPSGSTFREDACVIDEVRCPAGSTRSGRRCIGQVECPAGSAWDGTTCRAQPPQAVSPMPPPGSFCSLNINSIPSTTVLVDGHVVGPTPRVGHAVAPGMHTVLFVHDTLGKKTVSVRCSVGETKSVAVKMAD